MQGLRVTCDLCRWGLQFYLGSSSASNSILFCSKSSWFILKILIKCHFSRSAHLSGSRKTPRWHEVRLLIGSRGKKSGAIKLLILLCPDHQPFAGVETSYDINRQVDLGANELKCVNGMNIQFIVGPYPEVAGCLASCQQDYCFTQIGRRWFLQKIS